MLLRYCVNDFEVVSIVRITFVFTFHMHCIYIVSYYYYYYYFYESVRSVYCSEVSQAVSARPYVKSRFVARSLGSEECRVMGNELLVVCRSIMAESCAWRAAF
jgi:hypothetical protein